MRAKYKIKSLKDGKIFDTLDELCEYYGRTRDSVQYRLDKPDNYQDGYNFERVYDNSAALQSTKAVDTRKFVEKYGEKTVPIPGYEDHYTISTRGVITDIRSHNRILPIKTTVTVKHKVILHKQKTTMQTHDVINLLKKSFGDPDAEDKQ